MSDNPIFEEAKNFIIAQEKERLSMFSEHKDKLVQQLKKLQS